MWAKASADLPFAHTPFASLSVDPVYLSRHPLLLLLLFFCRHVVVVSDHFLVHVSSSKHRARPDVQPILAQHARTGEDALHRRHQDLRLFRRISGSFSPSNHHEKEDEEQEDDDDAGMNGKPCFVLLYLFRCTPSSCRAMHGTAASSSFDSSSHARPERENGCQTHGKRCAGDGRRQASGRRTKGLVDVVRESRSLGGAACFPVHGIICHRTLVVRSLMSLIRSRRQIHATRDSRCVCEFLCPRFLLLDVSFSLSPASSDVSWCAAKIWQSGASSSSSSSSFLLMILIKMLHQSSLVT